MTSLDDDNHVSPRVCLCVLLTVPKYSRFILEGFGETCSLA